MDEEQKKHYADKLRYERDAWDIWGLDWWKRDDRPTEGTAVAAEVVAWPQN